MDILVLGNGFDLAHELPTKYGEFLDFCKIVDKIYSANIDYSLEMFVGMDIIPNMNPVFIKQLKTAFVDRRFSDNLVITSKNDNLDMMYNQIKDNVWLQYFYRFKYRNKTGNIKENWIDFETEISNVIKALDSNKSAAENNDTKTLKKEIIDRIRDIVNNVTNNEKKPKCINGVFKNKETISNFADYLDTELKRLIRALEIYLSEFIGKLEILYRIPEIKELHPDKVLSFNYTNTYELLYGKDKNIEYDYIHGKASITNTAESNNMVLGINEYLADDRKDSDLEFITFKKYYQRIYKETGCKYMNWIDEIQGEYDDHIQKRNLKPHNLYIFGHSLDISDKDILKALLLTPNIHTTIFYLNKKVYGQQIKNLVGIIGQDELIRRTGGKTKTITFIQQKND